MKTTETRANRKKPPNGTNDPSNPRRTSSFVTDFTAKDTRRLGTGDRQSKPPASVQNCLCCSGSHKLAMASCLNYKTKISKAAGILWNIIGCVLFGDPDIIHRDRCESQRLCPCGSDKTTPQTSSQPPKEGHCSNQRRESNLWRRTTTSRKDTNSREWWAAKLYWS